MNTAIAPEGRVAGAAMKKNLRFLMCAPDHFSVEYEINPWMEGNIHRSRADVAREQWHKLHRVLGERAPVELVPPHPGVPDLVFTANAGLVLGKKVILSHFRHAERQAEEPYYREWFQANGFDVIEMPDDLYFEGAGDGLFLRGTNLLFLGYGFRTVLAAADFVAAQLDVEVVPLKLVDGRFYHLDTCFCPLRGGYLIYYPEAFDEPSRRIIEKHVPPEKRHAVSERDALYFSCNAVDAGDAIVLNDATPELETVLRNWGFDVVRTPLTEFLLAGGAAKCLTLQLEEERHGDAHDNRRPLVTRRVEFHGHFIDDGSLAKVMDLIPDAGGSFEVISLQPGVRKEDTSHLLLAVNAPDEERLNNIVLQLLPYGGQPAEVREHPARLRPVEKAGVAPGDFYSTTIFPTEIFLDGNWVRAQHQRMDAVVVIEECSAGKTARCKLLRDLQAGEQVVCGSEGIRVLARRETNDDHGDFKFMGSSISSERRVEAAVDHIAWEMKRIRERKGRIVFVAGPVVIHTGGAPHLGKLVRMGYVNALLGGNAIAVHDLESSIYGTSLGVDLRRGAPVGGGHRHHINVINTIRNCGSIRGAVEQGVITTGLFKELVEHDVPFCLAGSIRDDGPLPDTQMDLIKAQEEYQQHLRGAEMIVMLSSMLHSIGVGNMTPAGVRLICVDINPAVATKLADRGSVDSTPIVTDVGLFLNILARKLETME